MAVLAVLVVSSAGMLWADDAVQTNWAGGDGNPGPVLEWGDRFDTGSGVAWLSVTGQLALSSSALATPVEHLIDSSYAGNIGIGLGDIDGDGDIDVVGTAQTSGIVSWWENDGGDPPGFTEHEIGTPPGAAGVEVADVDGDGRLDVVLMLVNPRNKIVWKRNEGGDPITWGTQTIQAVWRDAWEISTGDVDGDENLDVMCTYWTTGEVAWWQNAGDDPITWTKHTVAAGFAGAHSVRGADLDDDGDMDLAAAAGVANKIVVFWSDGGDSITWTQQDVETGFTGARSVWIDDIDRDGDLDIAGICWVSDVAWWSNDGGDPVVWTRQTISTTADGGHALCIADINGDGRPDVLGACNSNNKIAWWENGGGVPIVWTEHVLNGSYDGAITVRAGDLDQDGAPDPVGAGYSGGQFSWWEATEFDSSGELTSSILDVGAGLGRIDWNSADPAGTSLMFQVRSSNDPGDLGSWSANITGPGSLPGVLERYIQYKVLLGTTDPDYSPILRDITIGSDSSGVEAVVGDHRIPGLCAQPNPFSPHIDVSFGLKTEGQVRLAVFDVTGRRVRELASTRLGAGDHRFTWDGMDDRGDRQSPGVYWILLETPDHRVTREVVLLR
ncbi:MAG: FG-GAP-like repeat-containing protein [Candidatus Eisenbacteria bacterium]